MLFEEHNCLFTFQLSKKKNKESQSGTVQVPVDVKQAEMFGRQTVFVSGTVIRYGSHHLKRK